MYCHPNSFLLLYFASSIALSIGLLTLFFFVLVVYIIIEKITSIQRKAKYTKELLQLKHNYEQTLLRSQLEIQEETLRNISQEIHDNIGQVLSLAKLQLNTFSLLSPDEGIEIVAQSKKLVSKAISDLRSLSKSLHPDRVNELGLEENILHELDMLGKTRLYQTSLKITGSPYKIPVQTQTILFRMVQEAISNIIKHAAATQVAITIEYNPVLFCLMIRDNGVGLPTNALTSAESGIGLKNMQHRCVVIGATFELEPAPDSGTIVRICLPAEPTSDTEQ